MSETFVLDNTCLCGIRWRIETPDRQKVIEYAEAWQRDHGDHMKAEASLSDQEEGADDE